MLPGQYFCHRCERRLAPTETVVDAAELHDVTNQDSGGYREYAEGMRAFFHPDHVPAGWREKDRGPLRVLKPDAT